MPPAFALLLLLAPVALIAVAVFSHFEPGFRPRRILLAGRLATLGSLVLALVAGIAVAMSGPITSPLIGIGEFGLSIRLDALSVIMFGLVSFVGTIVVQYSRNYLDGDARQGEFIGGLCLTLAAVSLLMLSGNLIVLAFAWIATSFALHRLLVFYTERRGAVIAARKKFITARIGDACLIGAFVLLASAFGTADIATILDQARDMVADGAAAPGMLAATLLIAIAALLKSAQFPSHGWLLEVMETPTPVSALLHAGIINAGGFLIVRFADVMLLSAASMYLLAIIGGFTALFGAVVMLTQTSVKVSLAWSTVAQMGFMLFQCGLGAFALAVLHIVAHSLYKAHAFLSSGSVVEIARASWVPTAGIKPDRIRIGASFVIALAIYAGIGALFGITAFDQPAILALGAIVVMGLTLLIAQSTVGAPNAYVIGRTLGAAGVVSVAYFVLQAGAASLLAASVPATSDPSAVGIAIMMLFVAAFALVTILQLLVPAWTGSPWWRSAYVHVANGFYANALFNRLAGALRRPAPSQS